MLAAIPYRESEHAAKIAHAIVAVFFVCVNDGFRVGSGGKLMAPADQIGREIGIVVDLAVEDDRNGAVFIEDRLLAAAEIDDAETAMAQAGVSSTK